MKKRLLGKVLAAFIMLAVSACFINLYGQVNITFKNDSADVGISATGGIQPLTLNFKINNEGKISLDAFTGNADSLVMAVVNSWDSDSVGSTDVASLFGYSFSLVATSGTDRLQCGYSETGAQGGLGVQGKNQRRIDDKGTEFIYFELLGEVGLDFTSIAYSDVALGIGNNPNLRFIDYDSDETYLITKPVLTGDTVFALPAGEIKMRNSLDSLTVTTSDTLTISDGNEGARLYGLEFNVVEAAPKTLPAGQVALNFVNETGVRVGNDATGSLGPLTLDFTIDAAGKISMDASTENENADVMAVVNSWDSDNLGSTENATLFDKSFSLEVTSSGRIQCDTVDGKGGLGVQGRNQWRIDDGGNEKIFFELSGDVGLEFVSIKYNSLASGNSPTTPFDPVDMGNLRFIDWNSDNTYILKKPGLSPFSEYSLPVGDIQLRYKTDIITVTTSDTITASDGEEGARLYGLVLNVVEPILKPPAVISTAPAHADTLVPITSDYVILFDGPMDQTITSGAVTITPDVANRANAWDAAGDELTISFDDLQIYTEYMVTVGAGVKGTNGLNALGDTTFTFRTLPDPPTVVYTYPVRLGKQLPAKSPLAIEFSRSMIPDSVEKAISFEPELTGLRFVWNEDNSLVYMISDEMAIANYVVTISTVATDIYGLQLSEPYTFTFSTSPVLVEDNKVSDVVLYPNPASDILQISGMDVASVKIYSLTGQLIKEIYNSSAVNVSGIKTGSYFVTVSDRDDNRVRKLIVIE